MGPSRRSVFVPARGGRDSFKLSVVSVLRMMERGERGREIRKMRGNRAVQAPV